MDYAYLRALGTKPRMHPNGFIQLDLAENKRLHVWPDPPLKTVDVETPMHDHTFSFTSTVLVGALRHKIYLPFESQEGEYRLYTVYPYRAQDKETPFVALDGKRYDMRMISELVIRPGETYAFPAFEFHSSHPIGLTATIIRVDPFDKTLQARVTCKHDRTPQFFKRDAIGEEMLWAEIKKVFPE